MKPPRLGLDVGKLASRLTLQRATEAADDHGQAIPTWGTLATRWGSVEPLSGRELVQAQQVVADVTHRVRVRYDSTTASLKPKDRVLHRSRTLNVLAALNSEERRFELVLLCREEV